MTLPGRYPTETEKQWLSLVKQTPCLACSKFHNQPNSVSEVHHIEGKTKQCAHLNSFALCAFHHRLKDNKKPPRWISRHGNGKKAFEQRYMPENKFLALQKQRCEKIISNTIGESGNG